MNSANCLLLVEDDPDDVVLIRRAITSGGYDALNIIVKRDGVELLAHLESHPQQPPQLLLLDLNLPRMNGREVLKALHTQKLLCGVPIVVFTTSEDPEDRRSCMELGATAYITKPESFRSMVQILSQMLERYVG